MLSSGAAFLEKGGRHRTESNGAAFSSFADYSIRQEAEINTRTCPASATEQGDLALMLS